MRVVRAQNLSRVISFGKMDPVCVLNTPRATVKTHAAENGDAAPVWDSGHNKFMLLVNARDAAGRAALEKHELRAFARDVLFAAVVAA